jgi:hypothetical protein
MKFKSNCTTRYWHLSSSKVFIEETLKSKYKYQEVISWSDYTTVSASWDEQSSTTEIETERLFENTNWSVKIRDPLGYITVTT